MIDFRRDDYSTQGKSLPATTRMVDDMIKAEFMRVLANVAVSSLSLNGTPIKGVTSVVFRLNETASMPSAGS